MSGVALRFGRPWSPARLAAVIARARRAAPATGSPTAGSLVGVEHEYRVLDAGGRQVDFRALLPTLPLAGRPIDPADRHAVRLPWGAALTADAAEAEVALPPLAVRRGTSNLAAALAARAADELAATLGPGLTIEGYSTHLSVAMPSETAEAAAILYARTFAPALMLLLDGPAAPGLLVRPRPGRLELGGDFRDGDGLAAALTFALGSALAAARAVGPGRAVRPRRAGQVPPRLDIAPAPAVDRYGWYVDRAAFGEDLYAAGRRARLPLSSGGSMAAGDHLRLAWEAARRELRGRASRDELRLVDDLVAGRRPLPVEAGGDGGAHGVAGRAPASPLATRPATTPATTPAPRVAAFRAPEGSMLEDIVRPGFTLRATLATWELTVFEATGARRAAIAVPRAELGAFLGAAATGLLDRQVERFLARPSAGDVLRTRDQALAGTHAWDGVGDPRGLLATEPGEESDAPARVGAGTALRAAGDGARAVLAAGRLAGIDLDGPDLGDRPGKRSRRGRERREEQRSDPAQQPPAQQAPTQTPPVVPATTLASALPASTLPVVPLVAGAIGIAGLAGLLLVTGVLGGAPAAPTPTPIAVVSAAPVASAVAAAPSPGASAPAPSDSAVAGLPPPLELARIEGTFNDGPDDSYRITVTPACATGPCDGSAVMLSLPIAAEGPRGSVSMPFAAVAGAYSGEGTATVPVCRTTGGDLLSAAATYRLEGFRATAQALVDDEWIATAISGTVVVGPSSVSAPGSTCSSGGSSETVALGWNDPAATPAPSPTAPPLDQARFDGNYAPRDVPGARFDAAASCTVGPCDADLVLTYWIDVEVKRTETMRMTFDGSGWTGSATFRNLRCSNGARADVTIDLRDFRATRQELIGGAWTATRLEGTFVRRKFKQTSGPGCTGNTEANPFAITRNP